MRNNGPEYIEYSEEEIQLKRDDEMKRHEREERNSQYHEDYFSHFRLSLYQELLSFQTPVSSSFQSMMNLKLEHQQNLERLVNKSEWVPLQENQFIEIKTELLEELCSRNYTTLPIKTHKQKSRISITKRRRSARIAAMKHKKYK